MKKLLSVLFVGLFTAVGSFASADSITINGGGGLTNPVQLDFSSQTSISNITVSPSGCSLGLLVMNSNDLQGENGACRFKSTNGEYSFACFGAYGSDGIINAGSYRLQDQGSNCTSISYTTSVVSDDPIVPDTPTDDNNSDNLLNPGVISSGVQSGVSAFTNGLGNLIPTIIIFGIPLVIVMLFWSYIRSYLKHIVVVDKPRGDDIANCNLTLNKYGQFEHHIIGQSDHGDYVDIPGVGLVGKDELPYYVDENLEFNYKKYKEDHETFDNRDPGIPGDDYYKRSEDVDEQSRIYQKYL